MTNANSIHYGVNEVNETFGVFLTPRLEKYQNSEAPETVEIQQWTWNFGNELKGKGYTVTYLAGPIALYEGTRLDTKTFTFKMNDQCKEFMESDKFLDGVKLKDCVIFLYQKLPNQLRYDLLTKEFILENRKKSGKKNKKGA
jgi:hypothetical protein